MKRKGLWLAGLALAGLLSFAPDAHAGVWVGFRGGPRHEVIVAHPGWYRVAGYRGWYGEGYGWAPGGWVARHHRFYRFEGAWRYRHGGRAFFGRGGHRR